MTNKPNMSKQDAIDELRREAQQLEDEDCSIKQYANNAYKAKIRRNVADKLERELAEENSKKP